MMPKVIGHRGFPRRYPENTIASFLGALLYGAHGVELDVRMSRDNYPVVIHDEDLGRVAGLSIRVNEATLRELKRVHLGMAQTIPTLDEVIDAVPKTYEVFVEIKELSATAPSYNIVAEKGWLRNAIFISFNEEVLRRIRSLDKDARLGINIDSVEKAKRALVLARELGLETINPPVEAIGVVGLQGLENYLSEVKRLGLKTVLWTVNDVEIVNKLRDKLDYIITDDPTLFVRHDG